MDKIKYNYMIGLQWQKNIDESMKLNREWYPFVTCEQRKKIKKNLGYKRKKY